MPIFVAARLPDVRSSLFRSSPKANDSSWCWSVLNLSYFAMELPAYNFIIELLYSEKAWLMV